MNGFLRISIEEMDMASELEVTMARVAILSHVPVGYGMTRDEADLYAKAALEAAESARAMQEKKNCKHPRKNGQGTCNSDGSSSWSWVCPDCGASDSGTSPPR